MKQNLKLQLIKAIFRGDLLNAKKIAMKLKKFNTDIPEILLQNADGLFYSSRTDKSYTKEEAEKEIPDSILIQLSQADLRISKTIYYLC